MRPLPQTVAADLPGCGDFLDHLDHGRYDTGFTGTVLQVLDQRSHIGRTGFRQREVRYGAAGGGAYLRARTGAQERAELLVLLLSEQAHRSQQCRDVCDPLCHRRVSRECAEASRQRPADDALPRRQGLVQEPGARARRRARAKRWAHRCTFRSESSSSASISSRRRACSPRIRHLCDRGRERRGIGEQLQQLRGPDGVRTGVVGLGGHHQARHAAMLTVPQGSSAVAGKNLQRGRAGSRMYQGPMRGLDIDIHEGARPVCVPGRQVPA